MAGEGEEVSSEKEEKEKSYKITGVIEAQQRRRKEDNEGDSKRTVADGDLSRSQVQSTRVSSYAARDFSSIVDWG